MKLTSCTSRGELASSGGLHQPLSAVSQPCRSALTPASLAAARCSTNSIHKPLKGHKCTVQRVLEVPLWCGQWAGGRTRRPPLDCDACPRATAAARRRAACGARWDRLRCRRGREWRHGCGGAATTGRERGCGENRGQQRGRPGGHRTCARTGTPVSDTAAQVRARPPARARCARACAPADAVGLTS